jgi:hypothetical protein
LPSPLRKAVPHETARPFKSDFALLDVKAGRRQLAKRIARGEKVLVFVEMVIDSQFDHDDGTSIEFSCDVKSMKIGGAA